MVRYIDADRFEKEIKLEASESIANAVVRILDRQPTADVVEIKHGTWLKNNTECSVCKALNPTMYLNEWELEYKALPLPHCPFCCAKMDLKEGVN